VFERLSQEILTRKRLAWSRNIERALTVAVTINNPFEITLLASDTILQTTSSSCAAIASPNNNGQIVVQWNLANYTFAFTHEFGQGHVYYQATI
jgi:hypothetical protein